MKWNQAYWDNLIQIYWEPTKFLGMRSKARKDCKELDKMICVPMEFLGRNGRLYTRKSKASGLRNSLQKSEEILNQIFNLTFSIAPDALINEALFKPLGFSDAGPIVSIGVSEIAKRLQWGENDNITQHDALFASDRSLVGVELKLRAPSSPEQIAKYATLFTWYEMTAGTQRPQIGLLFVVPKTASKDAHWKKCGLAGPMIDRSFVARKWKTPLNSTIRRFIAEHEREVQSTLDRMRLGLISWTWLRSSLCELRASLDMTNPGDQTLERLIAGFVAQLDDHQGTGIVPSDS
jgi:hypothetical protein